MKKIRGILLLALFVLPVVALSVLYTIRFDKSWLWVILNLARTAFLCVLGAAVVGLVLMVFYILAYHFLNHICFLLNDNKSAEKILSASFHEEMLNVFAVQGFIIAYAYQIFELWNHTYAGLF